jgi:hypothetical protein
MREIDVICRHILERPRRHKGIGAPLINLSIICECKSLSGWNVLLVKGDRAFYENKVISHWLGHEENLEEIVESISQQTSYQRCDKNLLYSYFSTRAHPDHMQVAYPLVLLQPPVELIATSFRATKGGENERYRSNERETINPFWSAIRSVLSATKAAKIRAAKLSRSYTSDIKPFTRERSKLAHDLAFFCDAELLRRVFFHPVIFCKARLFNIDNDVLTEVRSARIFVRNLDFEFEYVDLVNLDGASSYIDATVSDFEKQAYRSISKTWDRLEVLQWQPAHDSNRLAHALGLTQRRRGGLARKTDSK